MIGNVIQFKYLVSQRLPDGGCPAPSILMVAILIGWWPSTRALLGGEGLPNG